MKKITKILKDILIKDTNFPKGILVSTLAEREEIFFNLETKTFGYGDDDRDWMNRKQKFVLIDELYTNEEDMSIKKGYVEISYMVSKNKLINKKKKLGTQKKRIKKQTKTIKNVDRKNYQKIMKKLNSIEKKLITKKRKKTKK